MSDDRPQADRILVAQLTGEARHRAKWRELTERRGGRGGSRAPGARGRPGRPARRGGRDLRGHQRGRAGRAAGAVRRGAVPEGRGRPGGDTGLDRGGAAPEGRSTAAAVLGRPAWRGSGRPASGRRFTSGASWRAPGAAAADLRPGCIHSGNSDPDPGHDVTRDDVPRAPCAPAWPGRAHHRCPRRPVPGGGLPGAPPPMPAPGRYRPARCRASPHRGATPSGIVARKISARGEALGWANVICYAPSNSSIGSSTVIVTMTSRGLLKSTWSKNSTPPASPLVPGWPPCGPTFVT